MVLLHGHGKWGWWEACQRLWPWECWSWALLIDAFNTYCLHSRRHSEIVSEADQSGVSLEVGSEMRAFFSHSVVVPSMCFLFNFPSPSLLSAAVFPLKGERGEGAK